MFTDLDITMRKAQMTSSTDTKKPRAGFSAFFSTSDYPALIINAHGFITEVNERFLDVFQLKSSEILKKNFFDVLKEKNYSLPFQSINEGLTKKYHVMDIKNSDNIKKCYQWTLSSVEDGSSEDQYLMLGFEVTGFIHSQQREQSIKTSIIDHIPNHYIFWKDTNSVYMGCNTTLAQAMGLKSCDEIIGKTDYDLPTTKAQSAAYRADDKEVMTSGKAKLNIEEYQTLADGKTRVLMTSKAPIFDENGSVCGVLAIYSDITERKKMEQDLEKARDQAESANRAKSEFIANMSHDIRTPLTGIIGLSSILKDEISDPEHKEHAHMLNISGEQLLSLLNSVLDIVASDSIHERRLNIQHFNLREILYSLIELELPALELKSTQLHLELDDAIPDLIAADKEKIYRILLNLLSNAIKFTHNGHIYLSVQMKEDKDESSILQFQIKDTGIGIAPELQDKIFDEFFRASPSYEGKFDGYGVGLHIVQQYLKRLKGNILVKSEEGKGTCVTFTLPLEKNLNPVPHF